MTQPQIVDGRTGEIIQADDAFERHKRIIALRTNIESSWLQLGKELYELCLPQGNPPKPQWETLGHDTFEAYLADPDVDIDRRMAFRLKRVHELYQLTLQVAPGPLLAAGWTKLDKLYPYVTADNADEWLARAATLSRGDLAQAIAEELKPPKVLLPPPTGQFRCVVIDPPWPMSKIEREERPRQGLELDYPIMTLEEIAALPIPAIMFPDGCHVYLWVTQKYLPAGLDLFKTWGVTYQCLMTWVKPTGMTPYSWMYNTEHVLFGHVGSLKLQRLGLKLSFDAPIIRHSEKPEIFYVRVRDVSPEPRSELFARKVHEGFEPWGLGVET